MRNAHWIRKAHLFREDEYICSVCGASVPEPYAVCPSCGAEMKKLRYDPAWVDEAEGLSALFEDD